MANKTPDISIRGIRQTIPSGYLIGRSKQGDGQPHLIPMTSIKGTPGAPGTPGSNGVGVPVGGTAGQVLTKNSATDYDTGWATPSGGGGSSTRPSIVQNKSFVNNTGAVTLDAAPTAGNLLIAMGTHWNNNPGVATGWTAFDIINGSSHDGLMGAIKVANAADTASFTPFTGISGGANVTVFELANAFPALSIARYGIKEQTGTAETLYAASGIANQLVIGFFATTYSSLAPTSISSVTAGTTVTGTTSSGSPRGITPFHANADAATSLTITSAFSSSVEQYGMALVVPPA